MSVEPPIGKSVHSVLSMTLNLVQSAPGFYVSFKVPLQSRTKSEGVRASLSKLPWGPIFRSQSMIDEPDSQLGRILKRFVPMTLYRL